MLSRSPTAKDAAPLPQSFLILSSRQSWSKSGRALLTERAPEACIVGTHGDASADRRLPSMMGTAAA